MTKGRYGIMATILDSVDWESELENLTPNFQYNIWLQILKPVIDRHVPNGKSYNFSQSLRNCILAKYDV